MLKKATIATEQSKKQGAIEKVQIALAGSYGKNGNIDYMELKNNLNQVEGIEKIVEDINSLPYDINVDGINLIIKTDGKVDFYEGGIWNGTINTPKLTQDMTPVYWDESNNEIETNSSDSNWYNYEENKWANAKTSDGSYWVWIPRYAYKITAGLHSSSNGKIEIKFVDENNSDENKIYDTTYPSVTGDIMDDFVVHPAFTNGKSNNFVNGEWDKDLSGIWVAKFEISMETDGQNTDTTNLSIGNVSTSNSIKAVSKPNNLAWRFSYIGNNYKNSYNYDRNKDSHLIKNSEWGAIAYLSYSKYGIDSNKIEINNCYYSGGGIDNAFKINTNQSSTGNIYGVYDLCGGAWENTSSYISNGNESLITYGSSFTNEKTSTKYATIYPYNNENDNSAKNYDSYKDNLNIRFGDAILETSISGSGSTSWMGNYSIYLAGNNPFLSRGGGYNRGVNSGLFTFYCDGLCGGDEGFRIILSF